MWCGRVLMRAGAEVRVGMGLGLEFTMRSAQHPQSINYSRFASRNPSKVIMPTVKIGLKEEKIIELDRSGNAQQFKVNNNTVRANKKATTSRSSSSNTDNDNVDAGEPPDTVTDTSTSKVARKKRSPFMNYKVETDVAGNAKDNVFDADGNIVYTKLQNKDSNIGNFIVKLKSKKDRGKCGFFMVEGWRMVVDGLKTDCRLRTVIFSDKDDLEKIKMLLPQNGVRFFKIPYREIQMWSNLDTSPGVIAIFDTPKFQYKKSPESLPIDIICDNVREPGNLGSILRMADGVGCRKVLLTSGCVDIWEPKVLRSAAGAHFRLHIRNELNWSDMSELVPETTSIFVADNKLTLEREAVLRNSENSFTFENRMKSNCDNTNSNTNAENSIPILPYHDVDFSNLPSISLIVGGETEGISEDCYRFAQSKSGTRINIPLKSGVESLNSGMALAVIIFEIKRQLLKSSSGSQIEDNQKLEISAI